MAMAVAYCNIKMLIRRLNQSAKLAVTTMRKHYTTALSVITVYQLIYKMYIQIFKVKQPILLFPYHSLSSI